MENFCQFKGYWSVNSDFPILIGSGASVDNLVLLPQFGVGMIVGTTIKEGGIKKGDQSNAL